jgi:hypothetical protein
MKNTEILKRINTLLNLKVKLAQATLDNGTIVEADEFIVGAEIFSIDGENKNPLEVGTYTLEDGTIIEVMEVGKIGAVTMASAETEEVEAGKKKKGYDMEETPATMEEIISAVTDAVAPMIADLQKQIDEMKGATTEMKKTLSQTAKKPFTHKPTERVKQTTNSFDPQALIFSKLANL